MFTRVKFTATARGGAGIYYEPERVEDIVMQPTKKTIVTNMIQRLKPQRIVNTLPHRKLDKHTATQ